MNCNGNNPHMSDGNYFNHFTDQRHFQNVNSNRYTPYSYKAPVNSSAQFVYNNRYVYNTSKSKVYQNYSNAVQNVVPIVRTATVLVNPPMHQSYDNTVQNVAPVVRTSTVLVNPPMHQNYDNTVQNVAPVVRNSTVLVNPHFKQKVFINPNFKKDAQSVPKSNTIHINPNMAKKHILKENVESLGNAKQIHVNPKVLKSLTQSLKQVKPPIISTKNKLVRVNNENSTPKTEQTNFLTRNKIYGVPETKSSVDLRRKRRLSIKSTYKIVKSTALNKSRVSNKWKKNKYKLDNRLIPPELSTNKYKKRFVYINKFLSIKDIASKKLLRKSLNKSNYVNISGIVYKKSPNSLKRSDMFNSIRKSKYKIVKNVTNTPKQSVSKKYNKVARTVRKKVVSPKNLKKSNIPCPIFRKFGKCKEKEKGKCLHKHNPDQIALCTRFLQGACIKKTCLLSHNVSPEKMPTCKYYLEGLCAKDDCPYLHVKISPKAEICKDFLEGYCERAAQCDKRHQLLCPDYEKHGKCPKMRCAYPHGNMVRKYTVYTKFAKNCSRKEKKIVGDAEKLAASSKEKATNPRYYLDKNRSDQSCTDDKICIDNETGLRSRPKLGQLPAFIPFDDKK